MDAQRRSRKGDALLISSEGLFDIKLFEFLERFIEKDMAVEHVLNHSFEAGADLHSVRVLICRERFVGLTKSAVIAASLKLQGFAGNQLVSFQVTLGRRFSNLARQLRARRLLVPVNALQVIANILFVEGRL